MHTGAQRHVDRETPVGTGAGVDLAHVGAGLQRRHVHDQLAVGDHDQVVGRGGVGVERPAGEPDERVARPHGVEEPDLRRADLHRSTAEQLGAARPDAVGGDAHVVGPRRGQGELEVEAVERAAPVRRVDVAAVVRGREDPVDGAADLHGHGDRVGGVGVGRPARHPQVVGIAPRHVEGAVGDLRPQRPAAEPGMLAARPHVDGVDAHRALPCGQWDQEAVAVVGTGVGIGGSHVGPGLVGRERADELVAVVDVHHEGRSGRVVVDRPASPEQARRRHLQLVDVAVGDRRGLRGRHPRAADGHAGEQRHGEDRDRDEARRSSPQAPCPLRHRCAPFGPSHLVGRGH